MTVKLKNIIKDFWVSAKSKEIIELCLVPSFLSSLFFILIVFFFRFDQFKTIISEFTNVLVTVSSILAAFGIASTTILLTSSNNNLLKSKEVSTKRKKSNGTVISYFHLLLIRNFYNILSQIFLLLFSIISSLLINFDSLIICIFIIELFFLFHAITVLILTVTSMYHLMWNN